MLWQHLTCRESEVLGATHTRATPTRAIIITMAEVRGALMPMAAASNAYGCRPLLLWLQVLGAALDALRRVGSSPHGLEAIASRAAG